ncbi:MAG: alginate export family protein [Spirochaetota bacterium]
MKRLVSYLLTLFMFTFIAGASWGQEEVGTPGEELFPEFQVDEDMQKLKPAVQPFIPQYGGWVTSTILDERSEGTTLTTSLTQVRLWLQMSFSDNVYMYVRGRDIYLAELYQEYRDIENDNSVDLDLGYIGFRSDDSTLQLFLGRKYFLVGTGLVMNDRADGAEVKLYSSIVNLKLFGAYTGLFQEDTNPYNLSARDYSDGAKRVFAGGTLSRGIGNQELYVLGVAQMDVGDQESDSKSRYQSQYYGLGVKGVVSDSLDYYAEGVYEMGTSYTTANEESEIQAFAAQAGVNWFLPYQLNPSLILQYAFGSGDEDKSDYLDPRGNVRGNDTGFLGFGTYVGGYALRPQLANLHVLRAGGSFTPFSELDQLWLQRLSLTAKYSYYMKHRAAGVINSGEASEPERFVGHGGDVILRWKLLYDFSIFAGYAIFVPGDAYPDSADNRTFAMGGVTLVF